MPGDGRGILEITSAYFFIKRKVSLKSKSKILKLIMVFAFSFRYLLVILVIDEQYTFKPYKNSTHFSYLHLSEIA